MHPLPWPYCGCNRQAGNGVLNGRLLAADDDDALVKACRKRAANAGGDQMRIDARIGQACWQCDRAGARPFRKIDAEEETGS